MSSILILGSIKNMTQGGHNRGKYGERTKTIIRLLNEGMSQNKVAIQMGVSRDWIKQVIKKIKRNAGVVQRPE